jgi:hypothetical protein
VLAALPVWSDFPPDLVREARVPFFQGENVRLLQGVYLIEGTDIVRRDAFVVSGLPVEEAQEGSGRGRAAYQVMNWNGSSITEVARRVTFTIGAHPELYLRFFCALIGHGGGGFAFADPDMVDGPSAEWTPWRKRLANRQDLIAATAPPVLKRLTPAGAFEYEVNIFYDTSLAKVTLHLFSDGKVDMSHDEVTLEDVLWPR